jgi:hypothetical protein
MTASDPYATLPRHRDCVPTSAKFFVPARVSSRFVLGIRPIVGGLGPAERAIGRDFQPRRKMLAGCAPAGMVPKPRYGEAVLLSPTFSERECCSIRSAAVGDLI